MSIYPSPALTPACIPPLRKACTGSCPVATAAAACPDALPIIVAAASLAPAETAAEVAYLPAYDPTCPATYDLAVASRISPSFGY